MAPNQPAVLSRLAVAHEIEKVVEILPIDLKWARHEYKKIQDTQAARTIDLINFYTFENTGFRTVTVAGCHSC